MKRHQALEQLSRDHHQALFQAMRLKRAAEDDAGDVLGDFLDFWFTVGHLHFRAEEEVLLPAYSAYADARSDAVVKVLVDHVEIRREAYELGALKEDPPHERLHALGERLDAHVRHEERVLFPLIEEALPDDELVRVARGVDEVGQAAS
ncbi:MAG TPA: hemerythrin domain-containing protein [Thermoleophilaceae bacterium]